MHDSIIKITIGQIWRDNYNFGTGFVRRVEIMAIAETTVSIRSQSGNGNKMPVRKIKLSRFDGGKNGFSFESNE